MHGCDFVMKSAGGSGPQNDGPQNDGPQNDKTSLISEEQDQNAKLFFKKTKHLIMQ